MLPEDSSEISHVCSCYIRSTSWKYEPLIFTRGSTHIKAVQPNLDTSMSSSVTMENDTINIQVSRGSVVTHLRCGGKLAKVFFGKYTAESNSEKNDNQQTTAKVMNESRVACFSIHSVLFGTALLRS